MKLLDRHREDPTLVFAADNRSAYEISRRFLIPRSPATSSGRNAS